MARQVKMSAQFVFVAAFAALVTFRVAANAEDRRQIQHGRAIAVRVCARCHAVQRDEVRSPYVAAPPFQDIADARATTSLAVREALQSRHPVMPTVRLTEDERTDVIAYLMSLKRTSLGARHPEHRNRSGIPVYAAKTSVGRLFANDDSL